MKEKKKRNLKKDNSYPLERYIGLYSFDCKFQKLNLTKFNFSWTVYINKNMIVRRRKIRDTRLSLFECLD